MSYDIIGEGTGGYDALNPQHDKVGNPQWDADTARPHVAKTRAATGMSEEQAEIAVQELVNTGKSPTLDSAKEQMYANLADYKLGTTAQLVGQGEVDPATALSMVDQVTQPREGELEEQALVNTFYNPYATDEYAAEFSRRLDNEEANREELKRLRMEGLKWTGSTVGNYAEGLESFLPFLDNIAMGRLINNLNNKFDSDISLWNAVATGEAKEAISDWMSTLPSNDRIQVAKHIVEASRDLSGIFTDNDLVAMGMVADIIDNLTGEEDEFAMDGTRVFDNLVSLVDIVGVGAALKLGKASGDVLKGADVLGEDPTSIAATAARVEPEAGAKLRGRIIDDPTGASAANSGVKREEVIYTDLLPKPEDMSMSPAYSPAFIETQRRIMRSVGERHNPLALDLTEAEKVAQRANIQRQLDESKGWEMWGNSSTMKQTTNGVEISATYGKNGTNGFGFDDLKTAIGEIKQMFPTAKIIPMVKNGTGKLVKGKVRVDQTSGSPSLVAPRNTPQEAISQVKASVQERLQAPASAKQNARLAKKTEAKKAEDEANLRALDEGRVEDLTGQAARDYKELTKDTDTGNEYFLQVEYKNDYKISTSKDEMHLSTDDVSTFFGPLTTYIADINTGLAKHLADTLATAVDRTAGVKAQLTELIRPLLKSSDKVKKTTLDFATRSDAENRVFTIDELLEQMPRDLKPKEVTQVLENYQAIKNLGEVVWHEKNLSMGRRLDAQGFKHVVRHGDSHSFAKPVTDHAGTAYDQRAGRMLSAREVSDAVANGATVYKVKKPVGDDKTFSEYVMVGDNYASVSARPSVLLNKRDFYLPRMYDQPYYVTIKRSATVDGQKRMVTQKTIAANNVAEARKFRDAEKAKRGEGWEVDYRDAKEALADELTDFDFDIEADLGGLFYAKRGDHVRTTDGSLAKVHNPMAAMQSMISSVSRDIGLGPTIDMMKQRWVNTFGDISDVDGFPVSTDQIRNPNRIVDERVSAARRFFEYIQIVEDQSTSSRNWRSFMRHVAEFVEDKGMMRTGNALRSDFAMKDPAAHIRSVSHLAMIVFNPFRQAFIQTQQILFLTGVDGFKNFVKDRGFAKAPVLMMMASPDAGMVNAGRKLAKAQGVYSDEMEAIAKAYAKSGLNDSLDVNLLQRDAMAFKDYEVRQGMMAKAGQAVGNTASSVTRGVSNLGFGLGERGNLAMTYMLAIDRWKIQNPGKVFDLADPAIERAIAADTRSMALGMNTAGRLAHQNGILSVATQFLAVQQKAWLAGLQAFGIGNKTFTKSEARRILMMQTLLYGSGGWGLDAVMDKVLEQGGVKDLSPEARQALYGGMYDYTFNAAMSAISGEDVDLSVSENIAAGGGFITYVDELVTDFASGKIPAHELLLGPSYNVFSKVGKTVDSMHLMFGPEGEISPEGLAVLRDNFFSLASGYSNHVKMRAMQNHKAWVDKWGMPISKDLDAGSMETMLAGMFGLQSNEVQSYYQNMQDAKEIQKELEEDGVKYAEGVLSLLRQTASGDRAIDWRQLRSHFEANRHFLATLDAQDQQIILKSAQTHLRQQFERGDKAFVDYMTKLIMGNSLGVRGRDVIEENMRDGVITQEQGETLLRIDDMRFGE